MKPGIQSALYTLFGLAFLLIMALVLAGILYMPLGFLGVYLHLAETLRVWLLPILPLLVCYTWAVYYRLPFFRKQSRPQRILISSGLAAPFILMTLLVIYFGGPLALDALLIRKTDRRVETVTLPSGEELENHTYLKEGWGIERYNALFLKSPATGACERIDDPFGYWNYEGSPRDTSLLQRYPDPQEFVRGAEKVLLIGPFVCKRRVQRKKPYWDMFSFELARWEAADYVRSVWKPADPAQASRMASRSLFPGEGPEVSLHYQFDRLDLENNILTVKRVCLSRPEPRRFHRLPAQGLSSGSAQTRGSSDEFPDYLVYRSDKTLRNLFASEQGD